MPYWNNATTLAALLGSTQMTSPTTIQRQMAPLHGHSHSLRMFFPDHREGRTDGESSVASLKLHSFQNIIPISLYISIEGVRTIQALFIYFDHEMYYKPSDTPTLARTWNLSDDLGQIEYIFSDKTGTLTQNKMVFRQCSVGGRAYRGDQSRLSHTDKSSVTKVGVPSEEDERHSSASQSPEIVEGKKTPGSSTEDLPNVLVAGSIGLAEGSLAHFRDRDLSADIAAATDADEESERAVRGRLINGFFTALGLCHTALTAIDPETGAIQYKAQSPDEAALVQAAADVGFVFRGREKDELTLQTPFSEAYEKYTLLNILEFNSARKRMSVIVRKLGEENGEGEDGRLFLLTKGADNVIFERLAPGNEEFRRKTERHLDEFASEGLRTLTLAYKELPGMSYQQLSGTISDPGPRGLLRGVESALPGRRCLAREPRRED